jgi:AraC family transcriptional regulator
LRAATFTDHRRRIGRAVSHVDWHLDDEMNIRRLADIACFSPYHFLRVFQELTRETPLSMVRRLRLERARRRLAAGLSVTEAAQEACFESSQAFARAFRALFDRTPSSIEPDEIRLDPADLPPEIVTLKERRAIALGFKGTHLDLTDGFGHLLGLARPLMRRHGSHAASLSTDYPFPELDKPYGCQMLLLMPEAGLRETKLPIIRIAGGLHVQWRRRGLLLDSHASYRKLLDHTLPARGLCRTDGPVIRLFHNDPALVPRGNRKWSLFIPVAPFDS